MQYTPRVESTEQIVPVQQISNGVGFLVALPVISNYGSIKPRLVSNRQLMSLYTNGSVTRSDDISLKIAYALTQSTDIMICRVSNTEVMAGVTNKGTKVYYKDGELYSDVEGETEYNPTEDELFFVYSLSPSNEDSLAFEITKEWKSKNASGSNGVETLGELSLTGKNGTTSYKFSLDINSVDGYQDSMFVESINNQQSEFEVIAIKTMQEGAMSCAKVSSTKFGNSGYDPDAVTEKDKTTDMLTDAAAAFVVNALNKIARYRTTLKVKMVYDAALSNNNIVKALEKVAQKRRSLGVFTHPASYNTFAKVYKFYNSSAIKGLVNTVDTKSSFLYTNSPWRKDAGYLGWNETLPMTLFYILSKINLYNSNLEFQASFGKKNGILQATNLTIAFSHSTDPEELKLDDWTEDGDPFSMAPDTEQLQRLSCNPIIYDEDLGSGYQVNDLTFQTPDMNIMSDENNRRFFNDIQFDINTNLDDFIASANNEVTREDIGEMIDDYFTNVVYRKRETIKGYKYDITPYDPSRKNDIYLTVEVAFNDPTKFIKVIYRAVPVIG